MDANFSDRSYDILARIRGENTFFYHQNTHKRFTDHTVHIIPSFEEILLHMMDALRRNERFVFITNSSKKAKAIHNKFSEIGINVLLLCGDTSQADKDRIFNNVNEIFGAHDVIIYTPTLTAGVSYEIARFDNIYCYFTNGSCDGYTCDQMIGRIRSLRKKEMYICIKSFPQFLPNKRDELIDYINNNRNIIKQQYGRLPEFEIKINDVGKMTIETHDPYLELWLDNILVKNRFANDFFTNFMRLIKQKGCIIDVPSPCKLDNIRNIRASIKTVDLVVATQELEDLANAKDLTSDEFDKLKNSQTKTKDESLAVKKYCIKTFYKRNDPPDLAFLKIYGDKDTQNHFTNIKILYLRNTGPQDSIVECMNNARIEIKAGDTDGTCDFLTEKLSYHRKLCIIAYRANKLVQAIGFDSVLDTKRVTIQQMTNTFRTNAALFTPEMIKTYRQFYLPQLNSRNEPIADIKQAKTLVSNIIETAYGFTIGNSNGRSTAIDPDLGVAMRDIFKIIYNPKFQPRDFAQGYDDDDLEFVE
jgi:hypothetical protein